MSETEQVAVNVAPPVPDRGITIEIAYATVAAFEEALEVARRHPTFQQFGEDKSLRARVTYQIDELEALHELKEVTWELRQKRAWLDGREIAWHEMAEMTCCFREFLRRPRREHCFYDGNFWSGFGCRYALANLADRINNEWLTFGHLEPGGVWVFDKARIADYVKKNIQAGFDRCPAFDAEYLEMFLELFPERVDPVEDMRWKHLRTRQGEIIGVGPPDVDSAKKIVYELQEKIRERRSGENLYENAKHKVPAELFRPYQKAPKKKKGLLARLFG